MSEDKDLPGNDTQSPQGQGQDQQPAAAAQESQGGQEGRQVTSMSVLGSVFRAWFGVQTEENRRRDFNSNNPMPFIVAGIIFALVMIVGVIIAVNVALSGAGK